MKRNRKRGNSHSRNNPTRGRRTGFEPLESRQLLAATRVADIFTGSGSSNPGSFTNVNGTLYFTASDVNGLELWRSDGNTAVPWDINPGSGGSNPRFLTNFNGTLFFAASNGVNGRELWRINGNTTVPVADINGSGGSDPRYLTNVKGTTNVNGTLFFTADDGQKGRELWKSDGNTNDLVEDIKIGRAHV